MEETNSSEPQQFEPDTKKLTAAVVHLIDGSKADPNFGETKLVKLLYFADCAAFWRKGAPITGMIYVHNQFGPYPQEWYVQKRQMQAAGVVRIDRETVYGNYPRHRWTVVGEIENELLSHDEREILDQQLERFSRFNASGIVEYSHQEIAWLSTDIGEPMAYEMSGFAAPPLSSDEREMGERLADEIRR